LIVGLPHETEETLNESKKWIDEHWKTQNFRFSQLHLPSSHGNVKQSALSSTYEKQGYSLVDPQNIILDASHPDLTKIYQSKECSS